VPLDAIANTVEAAEEPLPARPNVAPGAGFREITRAAGGTAVDRRGGRLSVHYGSARDSNVR
jgi:hypothetical protein